MIQSLQTLAARLLAGCGLFLVGIALVGEQRANAATTFYYCSGNCPVAAGTTNCGAGVLGSNCGYTLVNLTACNCAQMQVWVPGLTTSGGTTGSYVNSGCSCEQ